ncbi:MAG: glucose-6-phosphate isomerase family protein [Bacillota bacterium]
MLDLMATAGLPLALDGGLRLVIPPGAGNDRPAVRTLEEMRPYLADPGARGPVELYFMYRDLGRSADRVGYGPLGLRFDVTVLIPGAVSGELVKTAGHYHPAPGGPSEGASSDGGPVAAMGHRADVSFPEVYGVIHGRAHYLLQDGRVDGLSRAFLVEAEAGEVVVVPPNFGHVTINPGPDPLVMANWVEATFASVYGPYAERRGACYYEFAQAGGAGGAGRVEPNPRYPAVPLERLTAKRFAARCRPGEDLWQAAKLEGRAPGRPGPRPLYELGVTEPQRLAFLTRPAAYDWGGLVGRR